MKEKGLKSKDRKTRYPYGIFVVSIFLILTGLAQSTLIITDSSITDSTNGILIDIANDYISFNNATFTSNISISGKTINASNITSWDSIGLGSGDFVATNIVTSTGVNYTENIGNLETAIDAVGEDGWIYIPSNENPFPGHHVFYVAKTGSDSNMGNIDSPFLTIQQAMDVAMFGDTVYVMEGSYNEQVTIKQSGRTNYPVTLTNYEDDEVTINGDGIGEWWTGLIHIDDHGYITIDSLNIHNYSDDGQTGTSNACFGVFIRGNKADGTRNIIVSNNSFDNLSASAVKVLSDSGSSRVYNVKVIYNTINNTNYNGSQEGISTSSLDTGEIGWNTITNCFKECIDVKGGSSNVTIHDNLINTTVIYTFSQNGCGIYMDSYNVVQGLHDISVYNNYVWGNQTGIAIAVEQVGGWVDRVDVYNNIFHVKENPDDDIFPFLIWREDRLKTNITIMNNIFYTAEDESAFKVLEFAEKISGMYISNNIFVSGAFYEIYLNFPSSENGNHITLTNNAYWDVSAGPEFKVYWNPADGDELGTNAVTSDPEFHNIVDRLYFLNSTSALIDAGDLTNTVAYDYNNNFRPINGSVDIGPCEIISELNDFNEYLWWN